MGSLVLTGNTSGSVTVNVPDVAGSNTATIGAATGTHYPFTAGTAVASTSGTSIDFTSIPSWVKRITVMFNGISTNGTSGILFQLGTSGGIQSTGYDASSTQLANSITLTSTAGFPVRQAVATYVASGQLVLTLMGSNVWVGSCVTGSAAATSSSAGGGGVTLSGTLDRIRITTVNGTDTFDAGSINILYE